jgi:spore germination cell wall hydrolase CwlJ-like protein
LQFETKARAERRTLFSAALAGAGMGLGLGAIYLAAGMAGHAADYAHSQRIAEAAVSGYSGAAFEAEGHAMTAGLRQYGLLPSADAQAMANRFNADRGAAKTRQRSDLECLTQAVYYEARGEGVRGQAAVAQVVLNRVKHPAFPKSVCAVVFQGAGRRGCQFSFACDGSMRRGRDPDAWQAARGIATRALAGALRAEVGSATHFHTTQVSPIWAPHMARVTQVGLHVFYRFAPRRKGAPVLPSLENVQTAVLTSATSSPAEIQVAPVLEKAIEASLEAPAPTPAPGAASPEPKPAMAAEGAAKPAAATEARLASPQPVAAGAS